MGLLLYNADYLHLTFVSYLKPRMKWESPTLFTLIVLPSDCLWSLIDMTRCKRNYGGKNKENVIEIKNLLLKKHGNIKSHSSVNLYVFSVKYI